MSVAGVESADVLDVLIVGLGPTGAVLAGLLAQWGVSSLVVETEREVYRLPRAAHFDHEIMRVFQQLGIADAVLKHARALRAYEFRNAAGQVLVCMDASNRAPSGWEQSYLFHQPAMEEALRARLAEMLQVRTRLGWSLESIVRNGADGATVRLASDTGEEQTLRARFVVACDGAGSRTRKALGVELDDYGFDEPWLVVDTLVPDESSLPECALQICDPARPTTVVPMSPGRRRWEFMLLPNEKPEEMLSDGRVSSLLEPWVSRTKIELVRKAVYRFHGLVAKTWRVDSVLLAGDAAHQMPPFLGQGMCSGIRDAAGLAWKIALVLQGEAPARLLDTYQTEREPHVRMIVETAIAMGRIVCTTDPAVAAMRDAQMLEQRAEGNDARPQLPGLSNGVFFASGESGVLFPQPFIRDGANGVRRGDDVLGRRFWLLGRGAKQMDVPRFVDAYDETCPSIWNAVHPWLEERNMPAVIVRPDRYVFGTGSLEPLTKALRQQIG